MTVRIHIDRLVVDPGALTRDEALAFRAALASELTLLRNPSRDVVPEPHDAVGRLARRTAAAIHDRMPTP
jgi:hypothetical protein